MRVNRHVMSYFLRLFESVICCCDVSFQTQTGDTYSSVASDSCCDQSGFPEEDPVEEPPRELYDWEITLIFFGCLLFVIIVIVLIYCLVCKKKTKEDGPKPDDKAAAMAAGAAGATGAAAAGAAAGAGGVAVRC